MYYFFKAKKIWNFLCNHKFPRYVIVGSSTFIIDFLLLVLLYGHSDINLQVATSVAYWTAIAYNFTLNRQWTFSAGDKTSLHKHIVLYLLLLGFNYLFTLAFVSIGSQIVNFAIAKIFAVAIQVSWTYYIYKTKIFVN